MDKTQKNSKIIGMKILESVQILYQNQEIDNSTKTTIVSLLKDSMKSDNFCKLNSFFKSLTYEITGGFSSILEDCIKITNWQNIKTHIT